MLEEWPPTDPTERQRQRKRLKKLLAELDRIPPRHREEEAADVRAEDARAMLAELGEED